MAKDSKAGTGAPVPTQPTEGAEVEGWELSSDELAGKFLQFDPATAEIDPEPSGVPSKGESDPDQRDTDGEQETEDGSVPDGEEPEDGDTDSEEDDETLSEEDEEVLRQISERGGEKVRKTINQKHRKMKEAQEALEREREAHQQELAQWRERLEKLEQSVGSKSTDENTSFAEQVQNAWTPDEIQRLNKLAKETLQWAEDTLDSDEEVVEVNGRELGRKEVRQLGRAARKALQETIPAQAQKIQGMTQVWSAVVQQQPAWVDRTHEDHKDLMNLWNHPGMTFLRENPYGPAIVTRLHKLNKLEAQEVKRKKKEGDQKPQEGGGKPREGARRREVPPSVPGFDNAMSPASGAMSGKSLGVESLLRKEEPLRMQDAVSIFEAMQASERK